MPHDVFISYSSIDRVAAFAACATFEAAGIRCWIAPRDVAAGAEWAEEIINAIEAARIMVLIFSANSNESRQVRREVELAVSRGLTIMPLRLEQIVPTKSMAYYMAGVHWIDAVAPPLEAHLRKMVGWIRPHLDGAPAAERPPEPRPEVAKPAQPPPPKPAAPKQAPRATVAGTPAIKQRRKSSSILGDMMFEFFGVGAKAGGIRINEAAKAIGAARALGDAKRYDEAIAAYDALIERMEDANVPNLDLNLATAQFNLAATYRTAGRNEQSLAAYRALNRSCGDIADEMVEKIVAMGMNNEASLLMDLGRRQQAIALQAEVVQRFHKTYNTELAEQVAVARLNRGVALNAGGQSAEAVAAYEELITQTNLKVWPQFGEHVTHGMINSASALIALKRFDDAIAACDRAIATRPRPGLLALALRNKIVALRDGGRRAEAIAAVDRMVAEFGTSGDKTIADQVAAVRKIRASL